VHQEINASAACPTVWVVTRSNPGSDRGQCPGAGQVRGASDPRVPPSLTQPRARPAPTSRPTTVTALSSRPRHTEHTAADRPCGSPRAPRSAGAATALCIPVSAKPGRRGDTTALELFVWRDELFRLPPDTEMTQEDALREAFGAYLLGRSIDPDKYPRACRSEIVWAPRRENSVSGLERYSGRGGAAINTPCS
jgi:hypothetical protein